VRRCGKVLLFGKTNQNAVNHWFTIEEVLGDEQKKEALFGLLGI
jgi:hypothetical protein